MLADGAYGAKRETLINEKGIPHLILGLVREDHEFLRTSRLLGDQRRVKLSSSPRNFPLWPELGEGDLL